MNLGEDERELFAIIDSRRTLDDVVAAAPLSEYETYEALQRMVEAGWVEPVGRREPGLAPPPLELSDTARSIRTRWERDLSVALLLIAAVVDICAAAQVRDLNMALDLYRREHGVYPDGLQGLVAERWLARDQIRIAGHQLRYASQRDRQAYRLELSAGQ